MKHDYRTILSIFNYVFEALFWGKLGVEVAAEDIPHDDFHFRIPRFDLVRLRFLYPPVGRSEQAGVCQTLALFKILHIGLISGFPPFKVVERVISNPVTSINQLIVHFRMFPDIISNAEKCRLSIKRLQSF